MPNRGVPVRGLFETHLTVSDLSRSVAFYRDVVGLSLALEVPERGVAFLWCGAPGKTMLGLWSLGSTPIGLSLHIAFDVELEHVLDSPGRLKALGVRPLSFFGEETDEPTVIGWMPAATVYFRDPDGHLLEYLAMLDQEPRADLGIIPLVRVDPDALVVRARGGQQPRPRPPAYDRKPGRRPRAVELRLPSA
jgi:lactoylglutathione lyase